MAEIAPAHREQKPPLRSLFAPRSGTRKRAMIAAKVQLIIKYSARDVSAKNTKKCAHCLIASS
jgi:hypothetical protein